MAKKEIRSEESEAAVRTEKARTRKKDLRRAAALAVGVHALLFAALFFAFQWKTQNEEVFAELWAETPATGTSEKGAPALEEPAPAPEPPKAEEPPAAKPAPAPEPEKEAAEEKRRADIALAGEKKKAEKLKEEKRLEEEKRRAEEKKKADERKKAEEKKKAAEEEKRREAAAKAQAEKVKAQEAARLAMAKVRGQELARVAGGTPSKTSAGVPTGDRDARFQNLSGSARASFIARVTACIRPNIIFDVPSGVKRGQYQAGYRVRLLPTGEQIGSPRKTRASGLPGYDAAVERAIAKCPRFPSAQGGAMPSEVSLTFDPVDNR